LSEREENKELQSLFDRNIPVYSYSKLSSWNECKYNWYMSYVLHKRSKDNIYSALGGNCHDSLEGLYNGKNDFVEAKKSFNNKLKEVEKMGIKFPKEPPTTRTNYITNMNHFFDTYKKMDTKMITEQFVLLKLPRFDEAKEDEDFIWIQMYVDSIIPVYEEGKFTSVIINDWKTSSKFDKHKLLKASRQLLLYKIGVEQNTGTPVSKIGWTMLKYVYCCYRTKGSKKNPPVVKKSIQQRKDCVKYFYKKIVNDLIAQGMDTIEAELLVGKAVNQNSFEVLPLDIQKKYWIEDCFLEYEFNDEIIKDCMKWVIDTVHDIEKIAETKIKDYPPVIIDEKSSYFCFNLCGRPDCVYLMKYKQDNANKFKKDKKEEQLNKEIGNVSAKINLDALFK
jgi:hypothetical protein